MPGVHAGFSDWTYKPSRTTLKSAGSRLATSLCAGTSSLNFPNYATLSILTTKLTVQTVARGTKYQSDVQIKTHVRQFKFLPHDFF